VTRLPSRGPHVARGVLRPSPVARGRGAAGAVTWGCSGEGRGSPMGRHESMPRHESAARHESLARRESVSLHDSLARNLALIPKKLVSRNKRRCGGLASRPFQAFRCLPAALRIRPLHH
jgi:hypothetical protein